MSLLPVRGPAAPPPRPKAPSARPPDALRAGPPASPKASLESLLLGVLGPGVGGPGEPLCAIQRATFGPLHIPAPTQAGGLCRARSSSSSPTSTSRALSLVPGLEWRRSPRASTPPSLWRRAILRTHESARRLSDQAYLRRILRIAKFPDTDRGPFEQAGSIIRRTPEPAVRPRPQRLGTVSRPVDLRRLRGLLAM